MELFYRSTRDDNVKVTASEAILKGLADDGGLFVPERIPVLDKSLNELSGMSYGEVAYEVMKLFLTDFTGEEMAHIAGVLQRSTEPVSEQALKDSIRVIRQASQLKNAGSDQDLLSLQKKLRESKGIKA